MCQPYPVLLRWLRSDKLCGAALNLLLFVKALLPSTICSSLAEIVKLLDDHSVTGDGTAVYQVAYQVIWSFLVEDSNLFLKYFMEKLTRENQEEMFQIIRNLIRKEWK